MDNGVRNKGIIAGVVALLVFVLIVVGLYMLGGDDQSALERLRDISIIFIVFLGLVTVVLLAAITVALILLFNVLKDRAVPILDETSGTINRIRNTTNFVTEEAVKPIVTVASKYNRMRAMTKVVTGKQKKPPKAG